MSWRRIKFGSRETWVILGIILVLVLGVGLRFYDLGEESLWNDELESWRQSSFDSLNEVITRGVQPDTHPPAFQVILFGVEQWVGTNEAQLRFPSALSGSLAILVLLYLGNRFFRRGEALMAALFLAVTWAPIYYSQEARNYALLIFFSLLASSFWMLMITKMRAGEQINVGILLGFILSGAATMYTHYFGLLLIVLQLGYLALVALLGRRGIGSVLIGAAGMILLFAPWLPSMIEQSGHTGRISWIKPPALTAFPAYFSFAFSRNHLLGFVAIALVGWLGWKLFGRLSTSSSSILNILTTPEIVLFYWLGAPMVVAYIVSSLWTPLFTQRNLLICLPVVYLLVARGIGDLPLPGYGRGAIALGISGVALYTLIFPMGYYRFDQKEQYREAVEYLVDRHEETGESFVIGYSRFPEYFEYYLEQFDSDIQIDLLAGEDEDVERLIASLDLVDPERIWFISAHRTPDNGFMETLQQKYSVVDQKSFIMAEVRLLKSKEE